MPDFEESNEKKAIEIIESGKAIFIDFWAPWWGPCKAMEPTLVSVAGENEGISFLRVNVDDNAGIVSDYGVQAIPTFIVFKGGEVIDQITGMAPKERVQEIIKEIL